MDFKHLKIDKGVEFDDTQKEFLKSLDDAFGVVIEKGNKDKESQEQKLTAVQDQLKAMAESQNYDVMQKQLNNIFEKLNDVNGKPLSEKDATKKEKALNNQWVRAMLRKDKDGMKKVAEELKDFDHFMHTGTQTSHDNYVEQGSYLIPELFQAEVNRFVFEAGISRREMRYLPFSGAGNERWIPALSQSVVVEWVDEAGRKPITKPYIGRVKQELKKLAAIVPFTDELLEDSAIDIMALTAQLIGEEIAIEEDRVFLAGSIVAGHPFNGVINSVGVSTFALGVGDLVADLTADHLEQAILEIPTPARAGAKWYMHPTVFSVLRRIRVSAVAAGDNEGAYLIQSPVGGAPASMWGYPIVLTDELPAAGDVVADDPFMFFANLSRTSVYGDKGGLALKELDQATLTDSDGNTINLAQNDMTAIRAVKRVGYVNVLPEGICVISAGPAT